MSSILPWHQSTSAADDILALKSNAIALHYACTHLSGDIHARALFPALVESLLDPRPEEGNSRSSVSDGQYALIRVASADGGFPAVARTAVADVPPLAEGDLVLWMALEQSGETMASVEDSRRSWIGLICGVLAPEVMPHNGHLRLAIDYGVIR